MSANHNSTEFNDQEFDKNLMLRFNSIDHLVDSIIDFKITALGNSKFLIKMYCKCCEGRTFWFSRKEIE